MLSTKIGSFPIGLRRGWGDWQRNLDTLLPWFRANDLTTLDLGPDLEVARSVLAAGLKIGSIDLPAWKQLLSPNSETRQAAVREVSGFITAAASLGIRNFFCVMLPEKPELKRSENFNYMVESFSQLASTLEKYNAAVVIEGWPGPGALCCTPESLRALFAKIPSPAMGINYDPSHLIRMGIDHIRFVNEFASRVRHVHGKDAEILSENLYDLGTEVGPTLATVQPFAGGTWRYTIPGHGETRWPRVLQILKDSNYQGAITIELEDANFNGTEAGEKRGILAGASFLSQC